MNLNMQAFNINTLLGGLDKVRDVMGVYQQQLLLIVIVFALLNCFFGYALRKLWSVIPGFFLGAAAGYAAGTYTNQTTTITLALAVGTGLLTAIIAFVLYRIGLFLLIMFFAIRYKKPLVAVLATIQSGMMIWLDVTGRSDGMEAPHIFVDVLVLNGGKKA